MRRTVPRPINSPPMCVPEMLALFAWKIEANQFDQMLIDWVAQSENDLLNEFPWI